jgi:purine-nucleoside phosphorylase
MSYEKAAAAADFIKGRISVDPEIAIVLGSGLGAFADELSDAVRIPYEDIPGFARSTVEGHAGQLVVGSIGGRAVAVQQGRFHYYEGYEMEQVVTPVRAFGLMGIKTLVLTNAAGSLDPDMTPGSLMLISDHLNCLGSNPLRGPNDNRFGSRFPDMTQVYDRDLQQIASEEAEKIACELSDKRSEEPAPEILRRGVYCALSGPTYETPAEIRMYRLLGADAVGMSTVPEAIAARHMGIRVLGISCITNFAAGMTSDLIHHDEVMETGAEVAAIFKDLLVRIIGRVS